MTDDVIQRLGATLAERRSDDAAQSYTAALMQGAREPLLKKIGEEATEVILADNQDDDRDVVHEVADLWFHTLVLLVARGLEPAAVLDELERRMGTSGFEEKAARGGQAAPTQE